MEHGVPLVDRCVLCYDLTRELLHFPTRDILMCGSFASGNRSLESLIPFGFARDKLWAL